MFDYHFGANVTFKHKEGVLVSVWAMLHYLLIQDWDGSLEKTQQSPFKFLRKSGTCTDLG